MNLFKNRKKENDMELTKVKKRDKIVIHYEDGTTEEYKVGVLFALESITDNDGEVISKIVGKHCNTNDFIEEFNYAMAQIIVKMLEGQETIKEFCNE